MAGGQGAFDRDSLDSKFALKIQGENRYVDQLQ